MTGEKRFYVVRAVRRGGNVTYDCPTPEWAWRKFQDFKTAQYTDITIADPDGLSLTEADLEALLKGEPAPTVPALEPQA